MVSATVELASSRVNQREEKSQPDSAPDARFEYRLAASSVKKVKEVALNNCPAE